MAQRLTDRVVCEGEQHQRCNPLMEGQFNQVAVSVAFIPKPSDNHTPCDAVVGAAPVKGHQSRKHSGPSVGTPCSSRLAPLPCTADQQTVCFFDINHHGWLPSDSIEREFVPCNV